MFSQFPCENVNRETKKNVINLFNIITLSALMILISESTESLFQFSITFQFSIYCITKQFFHFYKCPTQWITCNEFYLLIKFQYRVPIMNTFACHYLIITHLVCHCYYLIFFFCGAALTTFVLTFFA